jgi:hypothetical protein
MKKESTPVNTRLRASRHPRLLTGKGNRRQEDNDVGSGFLLNITSKNGFIRRFLTSYHNDANARSANPKSGA